MLTADGRVTSRAETGSKLKHEFLGSCKHNDWLQLASCTVVVLVACLRSVDLSVGFPVVWPVRRLSVGSAVSDGIAPAGFDKIRSLSSVRAGQMLSELPAP